MNWVSMPITYRKKESHEAKGTTENEGDEGEVPECCDINESTFSRG